MYISVSSGLLWGKPASYFTFGGSFCFLQENCLFPTEKERTRSPLYSLPAFLQQLAAIFNSTSPEEFS